MTSHPDELDLRKMLGNGRVYGGLATALVLANDLWKDRYTFLARSGPTCPVPTAYSVVLDSSVLIDLEQVVRGLRNDSYSRMVQELVLQLASLDVLPGLAMAELTSGPDNETRANTNRARLLHAAVNAWFDGGAARARFLTEVKSEYRNELSSPVVGPLIELVIC